MRFVDEVYITVQSGAGGAGCLSFRREKFIPRGGPDGGNGGNGGSVLLKVNPQLQTLYDFQGQTLFQAARGQNGKGSLCHGKNAPDLILAVPPGTLVYALREDGEELLADLQSPEATCLLVKGGLGGKGNAHFKSSTMRTPRFAQKGEAGQELNIKLELKIIADVGLIGFPNAGKSSLLAKLSTAHPKIAAYPFTTLEPILGMMLDDYDPDLRLCLADLPGLIQGASKGVGLGTQFLRHAERTLFLVHLLSCENFSPNASLAEILEGFTLINLELEAQNPELMQRPQIQVISKIDLLSEAELQILKNTLKEAKTKIFLISSVENHGLEELKQALWQFQKNLQENLQENL